MPRPPDAARAAPLHADAGVLLSDSDDPAIAGAAALLAGWRFESAAPDRLIDAIERGAELRAIVLATDDPAMLRAAVEHAHWRSVPVVMACSDDLARRRAIELRAEEWYDRGAAAAEIAWRLRSAIARAERTPGISGGPIRRDELLYDTVTGMPTLPAMIERVRALFRERGELVVFYLDFVRYAKIEEIYGWEKLDEVLETTAAAVRAFLEARARTPSRLVVGFANADDFILFHVPMPGGRTQTDQEITTVARDLQRFIAGRLEAAQGEDIAALFEIYVGYAHVYHNPKIRLERLIYRGIREAAHAARSIEQREQARRVADLKRTLHDRNVYIEYHPIVRADGSGTFGYEALARGRMRSLRSPEVMFEVAARADLVWELSRLCRSLALAGMASHLTAEQLLFLNVDPHDFADPSLGPLAEVAEPERVVIEITERTAITDYPRLRERLRGLRERGFRFAVDDAGSGYAGLGSIANLEPDFIKLDISLIKGIDTNFIKQNLVETLVGFARDHGALVIAEGVERSEELDTVRRLGVPLVQGFLLARPGNGAELATAISHGPEV